MDIPRRIDQLECVLDLKRRIVGVKFLYDEKAFDQNVIDPVKNMFSFCMMVKVASSGAAIKAKKENFKCPGAKRAFGMMKVDDHFSSGARYLELGLVFKFGYRQKSDRPNGVSPTAPIRGGGSTAEGFC